MHFFILLVPFVLIIAGVVFVATIGGFLSGLVSYAFNRDVEALKAVWIVVTTLLLFLLVIWIL
jgi:hypothetical protein